MEYINQILNTTIKSFDFSFCLIVNVLTYTIIKFIDSINGIKKVATWTKRIIMLSSVIFISIVYYIIGSDTKLIINSAILAPVSWSWIFKPICKYLNIDYKDFNILD